MSVQFNAVIRVTAPGVTARIIASAPFDIRRDRLPPRTGTPKYFFLKKKALTGAHLPLCSHRSRGATTRQRREAERRPEPLPDVRVAPYRSRSCRATPLVQPKPSCTIGEREERRHFKKNIHRQRSLQITEKLLTGDHKHVRCPVGVLPAHHTPLQHPVRLLAARRTATDVARCYCQRT